MGSEEQQVCIVLVTAPSEGVARELARSLVKGRLAACVNVLPGLTSIYSWKGELCEDSEVQMIVKTTAGALRELERAVLAGHPYETPEFVVLKTQHVEARYLAWLLSQVD